MKKPQGNKALFGGVAAEMGKLAAEAAAEREHSAKKKTPKKGAKEVQQVPEFENANHAEKELTTRPSSTPEVAKNQTEVFVSDIPDGATTADLEDAFSDAGPLRQAKVLKGGKGLLRFVLAADASRCVSEMQSRQAGRSASADTDIQGRKNNWERFSTKKEAKAAVEEGNGTELLGRPVAVDWAVAKEIYQEQMGPPKRKQSEAVQEQSDLKKRKVPKENKHDDGDEEEEEKEKDKDKEEEKEKMEVVKTKKQKTKQDEEKTEGGDELNRTVFVRNVPLEATEKELKTVMFRFGKVKLCRLVMDKSSGRHRGSAFVHFQDPDAAHAACQAGGAFTGTEDWERIQQKQDKRRQQTFVKGALEDEFTETLQMGGRHLFVAMAVDRRQAQDMVGKDKEKIDRRNLYLAKEGLILEDSPQAKDCSPADLNKRLRDWQEKKQKLTNPNFSVNRTRLSVRNVSRNVSEKELRELFHGAAAGGGGEEPVKVLQARLVLDKEKIDPETGKGVSRGYGFVEFSEHKHALAALRRLNNSALAAKQHNGGKRLMIDFALEDARKARERRIKVQKMERIRVQRAERAKEEGGPAKKLGRGARRRLKKEAERAPAEGAEAATEDDATEIANKKPEKEKPKLNPAAKVRSGKGEGVVVRPSEGRGGRRGEEGKGAKRKEEGKAARSATKGDVEVDAGQKRKRQRDETVKTKPKPKKPKGETDDLDTLVQKYNTSLFGGANQRWFD